jgi:hypothetical protein
VLDPNQQITFVVKKPQWTVNVNPNWTVDTNGSRFITVTVTAVDPANVNVAIPDSDVTAASLRPVVEDL